jgi:hypothetical protein
MVGIFVGITSSTANSSVTNVHRCSSGNHIVISQKGHGGAGGQFLFGVVVTNRGITECSVLMPTGQPVNGPHHLSVGPPSRIDRGSGSTWPLLLKPRSAASFWYAVTFYQIISKAQCNPIIANGAIVRVAGIRNMYLSIPGPYANEVCDKSANTSVEFVGLR